MKDLFYAAALGLALSVPTQSLAGSPPRATSREVDRVEIRTSDDSSFQGALEDKDGNLVTIKTDQGETLNLPMEEIRSINGIPPANFFKKFIPVIPESRFQTLDVSVKDKVRYAFKFLSSWNKSQLSNGYLFTGPEDDRRWEGYRFSVNLESPPASSGEITYKSVLEKITKGGTAVLSESYDTVHGAETLRTTEVMKGNFAARALRQIRTVNGEKCLLEISMSHQVKEKLNSPMAIALFEKVAGSIRFPRATPPKGK